MKKLSLIFPDQVGLLGWLTVLIDFVLADILLGMGHFLWARISGFFCSVGEIFINGIKPDLGAIRVV